MVSVLGIATETETETDDFSFIRVIRIFWFVRVENDNIYDNLLPKVVKGKLPGI